MKNVVAVSIVVMILAAMVGCGGGGSSSDGDSVAIDFGSKFVTPYLPSNVTANSAKLSFLVNTGAETGLITISWWVAGNPMVTIGSDLKTLAEAGDHEVEFSIAGLLAQTAYEYVLVINDGVKFLHSHTGSFKTGAVADIIPEIISLTVSDVTSTSARLTARVQLNGHDIRVQLGQNLKSKVGYHIVSTEYFDSINVEVYPTFLLEGLTPGTNYTSIATVAFNRDLIAGVYDEAVNLGNIDFTTLP